MPEDTPSPEATGAPPTGPDFGDAAPARRVVARAPAAPPAAPPDFEDARGESALADAPPAPAAGSVEGSAVLPSPEGRGAGGEDAVAVPSPRTASRWPRRIATAATILAILAIVTAIFLPKEKAEVQPQAGPATVQPAAVVQPTPSPQPQENPSIPAAQPRDVAPDNPQPAPTNPTPDQKPNDAEAPEMGTCPTCGGTGTRPCIFPPGMHDSQGRIMHPEAMGVPEGDELREDLTGKLCPFCHGTLKMKCPQCGGTGKVPKGEAAPANPMENLARSVGIDPKTVQALSNQPGAGGGQAAK